MDSARGISPRSVIDALVFGLTCIPKLVVLGLALFLVSIAVFIVLAILFLICKIPFLGPLLFAVVFPLSVVVAGVTLFGLFLCMALSLPAIWQGATISRALSQTLAIARSRLVEAVLLLVFVSLLGFAVSLIVFAVLGFGFVPTLGMSAAIVGFSGMGDMGGMGMGALGGMAGGMGGGGGHAIAGMIGGFVLWALAISLVSQVNLLGLCLVYLRVTEGLDLTASDEALRRSFDEARRRTTELAEKAKSAAQRATEGSSVAAGAGGGAASASVGAVCRRPVVGDGAARGVGGAASLYAAVVRGRTGAGVRSTVVRGSSCACACVSSAATCSGLHARAAAGLRCSAVAGAATLHAAAARAGDDGAVPAHGHAGPGSDGTVAVRRWRRHRAPVRRRARSCRRTDRVRRPPCLRPAARPRGTGAARGCIDDLPAMPVGGHARRPVLRCLRLPPEVRPSPR